MTDYHRTQIQLEKWQYARLKERAAEEGISLSELVRQIVEETLRQGSSDGRERLKRLRGRWSDPGFSSKDHDDAIYGLER